MMATPLELLPELYKDLNTFHRTGVLPSQTIKDYIKSKRISAKYPITEDQIQPASLESCRVPDADLFASAC